MCCFQYLMEGHSHRGARREEGWVDVSPRDRWWSRRREARRRTLDWWPMHHWWRSCRRQTHGRASVHWRRGTSDGGWESHRWSPNMWRWAWRRGPVDGGARKGWGAMWGTSAHWRRATHGGPTSSASKVPSSWRAISRAIAGPSSLTCTLWRSGLALSFKLVQRLFGGIRDHRILAVQLLLRQHVHHLPHASLAAKADTAEALALAICTVFIELHLDEVGDAEVDNAILDVLVSGPPSEVANIQLPPPPLLPAAAAAALPALLLLLLHHRRLCLLLLILARAGRDHVVIEVIVLIGEVLLGKVLLDIRIQVDVNSPITRHLDRFYNLKTYAMLETIIKMQTTSILIFAKSNVDMSLAITSGLFQAGQRCVCETENCNCRCPGAMHLLLLLLCTPSCFHAS